MFVIVIQAKHAEAGHIASFSTHRRCGHPPYTSQQHTTTQHPKEDYSKKCLNEQSLDCESMKDDMGWDEMTGPQGLKKEDADIRAPRAKPQFWTGDQRSGSLGAAHT